MVALSILEDWEGVSDLGGGLNTVINSSGFSGDALFFTLQFATSISSAQPHPLHCKY